MNSIMQKLSRISMLYLRMMYNLSSKSTNKGRHHTVNKAPGFVYFLRLRRPPPASLGDGREDDFHLRELPMEVLQVLFDPCNKINAFGGPKVISATVDQQDIWHSSSSKALTKEGEEISPNHATPAKPPDLGTQTKVGPDGLPRMFFPTANVAVPNNVYFGSC